MNMGIKGKFVSVIAVFIVTLGLVFGAAIYGMTQMNKKSDAVIDEDVMRRIISNRIVSDSNQVAIYVRDLMLTVDDNLNADLNKNIDETLKALDGSFEELNKLKDEKVGPMVDSALAAFGKWKIGVGKVRELATANKNEEAYKYLQVDTKPDRELVTKSLHELIDVTKREMTNGRNEAHDLASEMRNLMIIVSVIGLGIGSTLAYFVITNIIKSVNRTVDTLTDTANQVAAAAHQVSSSSQSLSQAATEQASSLEETSSAVEEMSSMIGRNSESARESADAANRGAAFASKGQKVVENMMRSMSDINNANQEVMRQTNESNTKIAEIVSVINEIGNKTKVINEIVFQTKLLSFNASVEAARAGEHGKGFAVVAEEVGNLAQMSGNAAKDITSLLEGSIAKVQGIVSDSKTKIEKILGENAKMVQEGTRIAEECRDVLSDISKGTMEVTQMAQSIAGASDEQARGISEINRAIIQLDQVTQVNAATSEEAASASEELSAQAEHMKGAVGSLVQIVRGGDGSGMDFHSEPSPVVRAPTHFNKPAAKGKSPSRAASNVIHLGRSSGSAPARMAVGDNMIPGPDDERFKDI